MKSILTIVACLLFVSSLAMACKTNADCHLPRAKSPVCVDNKCLVADYSARPHARAALAYCQQTRDENGKKHTWADCNEDDGVTITDGCETDVTEANAQCKTDSDCTALRDSCAVFKHNCFWNRGQGAYRCLCPPVRKMVVNIPCRCEMTDLVACRMRCDDLCNMDIDMGKSRECVVKQDGRVIC